MIFVTERVKSWWNVLERMTVCFFQLFNIWFTHLWCSAIIILVLLQLLNLLSLFYSFFFVSTVPYNSTNDQLEHNNTYASFKILGFIIFKCVSAKIANNDELIQEDGKKSKRYNLLLDFSNAQELRMIHKSQVILVHIVLEGKKEYTKCRDYRHYHPEKQSNLHHC